MSRISFSGFRDAKSRPKYLIWSAVALMVLGLFVALGVRLPGAEYRGSERTHSCPVTKWSPASSATWWIGGCR